MPTPRHPASAADAPGRPRDLADATLLAARRAMLSRPAMLPLVAYADALAAARGLAVPYPDPADAGVDARLLLLLEQPGPNVARTGLVSRDNPNRTAANLRRFLDAAGVARTTTLLWNVVPWTAEPERAGRGPRASDVRDGTVALDALLPLLPNLELVVLAGRHALAARPRLSVAGLGVLAMPHPSPTYLCTSPDVTTRIETCLAAAARRLDDTAPGRAG